MSVHPHGTRKEISDDSFIWRSLHEYSSISAKYFSEGRKAKDGLEREYVRYYSSFGITLIGSERPRSFIGVLQVEYPRCSPFRRRDICMDAPHSPESACSCARTELKTVFFATQSKEYSASCGMSGVTSSLTFFWRKPCSETFSRPSRGLIEHVGTMHMIEIVDKNFSEFLGMREVRSKLIPQPWLY